MHLDITGLPAGPDDMEITPDGKTLWVTLRFSKKVGGIDIPTMKLVTVFSVLHACSCSAVFH
ncbi:MAG TPA: hypothetical protein DCW35_04025 [Polynucleobacter sp.]|nr:hypothetical protein [Polynucleobacter necessarius]HAT39250.1 hypothetical protein [Polynucleobacter sp.]